MNDLLRERVTGGTGTVELTGSKKAHLFITGAGPGQRAARAASVVFAREIEATRRAGHPFPD
jgi:hypothetical protein